MGVEIQLKKLLQENGYIPKTRKDGSTWTKGGSVWTLWRGQRGTEVNYHDKDTVSFNYLSTYMRETFKQHGDFSNLNHSEQDKVFDEFLSKLPFYDKIKNHIPHKKRSQNKGIEYFSISSQAGMNVFKEIVDFIVSEKSINYEKKYVHNTPEILENNLPKKADADRAIEQLRAKAVENVSVEAILNQIEKNFFKQGESLKSNWRIITERNIREYWYK
jgi:hypothetical protein